jgi:hypothetical protein
MEAERRPLEEIFLDVCSRCVKMIVGLRIAKGRILRRIARYGLLGAAVAVLPLQQSMAGTGSRRPRGGHRV